MKFADWTVACVLAGVAYVTSNLAASAAPPSSVFHAPAPLIGVGPLAFCAVALVGGVYASPTEQEAEIWRQADRIIPNRDWLR
jgi:hypothetical protein